jgi:hypothetical protein
VAHNTARGTADGTLFLGTMARSTSLIGKTSGALSRAEANKILMTRANTALGIGLSTSAGDMPHLVDMWKENPGNFSSTFGRVMQTSTAAFGLGGTTLVSGVYGRIRGTSAKMSAKNIEELSERLPNEMRFSSPEEFLQKIQLLKFADDVAGKKVASIEEAQQIQDKILEATLWNDGEPVMNLKLAEKIIEEHNNPQIIPKSKNITLTVEKKKLTELDLRRIKTEVDLVPIGRLQKTKNHETISNALAAAELPTIARKAESFIITKTGYVKKTAGAKPIDAIGEFYFPKVEMAAPKMDAKTGLVDRVWLMSKLHEQFKGQFTIEKQYRSGGMKEAYIINFKDEFGRDKKIVVKLYSPERENFLRNRNKDFTEMGAELLQRDLGMYDYLVAASKETNGRVRVAEILSRDMPDLTRYGIVVQEYLPDKTFNKVTEKSKDFSQFDRFYEKHEVGLFKFLTEERASKKMQGIVYQSIERIRARTDRSVRLGAAIDLGADYNNLRQRKLPDGSVEYVFIDY